MSDAPWSGRRLHFIGIGGAGMSGLAIVALGLGARVSGSDRAESVYVERLREAGIEPAIGHDPGGFGASYPIVHTSFGDFYYGHCVPTVADGASVSIGQPIAAVAT